MVITHNMMAMNGNRQLGIVTKRQAKSTENSVVDIRSIELQMMQRD